jgi:hypothetical protein
MYFEQSTLIPYNVTHISVHQNNPWEANSHPEGQTFQRFFLITKHQYWPHKLQVTDSQILSSS